MRLTTVILIASLMQVSATTLAQRITLKQRNANLETILKEIRKQSSYDFFYDRDKIQTAEPISINVKNATVEETLESVFAKLPLTYTIDGKLVSIKPKEPSFLDKVVDGVKSYLASIDVFGRVVDENGAPLGGASVLLKSNGKGVSTAVDGNFYLKNVEEGAILVVKFLGYEPKEIKAEKDLGIIRLEQTQNPLDEVQIQAYTQTSKRLSLSNSASVKAKDIEDQIISNPLLALQGRVAGIQITQLSGNVGSSITVRIQGNSSLRGSSTPYYVVDGVPYSATSFPGTGNRTLWGKPQGIPTAGSNNESLGGEGSGSPLTYLNPNDIESIDVLKDADATAIYGSRAANGAIIITTKKGKPGATKVDFNAQRGWNKVPFGSKLLNTEQYLEIRREAYRNGNQSVQPYTYDLDGTWDQTRSTDWQKEFFKTTSYSNANLGVSGGTINSNYRIGLTANRQRSPYGADFKNDNVAVSTSLNTASLNQKFKMNLVANYLNGFNNLPSLGNVGESSFLAFIVPNAPSLYNPDGSLNWGRDSNGLSTVDNPVAKYLINPFETKTNNLTSNISLTYNIGKGLDFKTSLGYTRMNQQEFSADLGATIQPEYLIYFTRSGSFRFTNTNSYIAEPQLFYNRQFANHKLNVIVGGTYNRNQGETSGISGFGQSSDALVRNLAAASSFNQTGAGYSEYKYNAIFSRIDYNYKDRYLFGLSGRRDGSTRFGPANRFANFWSIAGGWIISEEQWVRQNLTWLSFFKFRGSYGLTGSDGLGDYSFMDLYEATPAGVPYQNIVGFSSKKLLNAGLQWEEKRSLNIGLDANFLKDRITLGINYNRNRSSNLLQDQDIPVTTGFSRILVNFDALVQNTGWEYTVGVNLIKEKNVQWNLNANLTVPKNKLLALPNQNLIPLVASYGYEIGQPLGTGKFFNYMGVNPLTGLEVNEDMNGNPVISTNAAQLKGTLFNRNSPYNAGLQSTLVFKGLSLNLSFDYVNQMQQRYLFSMERPGASAYNQPEVTYSLNRWKNPGDIAVFQKYSILNSSGALTSGTVANYENASYLRLNNAALSWNIPARWVSKLGMKNSGIGLNAQNLFVFSRYSGPNPITGAIALPIVRTVVATLRAGF